jgi:energy-coupling factor transporter ATP-binding protein EcfA2
MSTHLSLAPLYATTHDMQLFVNREKETKRILDSIEDKLNILVVGDFGSGKTTLLNRIKYLLQNDKNQMIISVSLPIQTKSPYELIAVLLRELTKKARELPGQRVRVLVDRLVGSSSESHTRDLEYLAQGSSASIELGYEVLDQFIETISIIKKANKQILFLIDETDKIPNVMYQVLSSLREPLWQTKSVFVFAGSLAEKDLYLRPPVEAFLDTIVNLEPFDYENTVQLVKSRLNRETISREVLKNIFDESNGNPSRILSLLKKVYYSSGYAEPSKKEGISQRKYQGIVRTAQIEADLDIVSREIIRYIEKTGAVSASDSQFQAYLRLKRPSLTQKLKQLKEKGLLRSTYDRKTRKILYNLMD